MFNFRRWLINFRNSYVSSESVQRFVGRTPLLRRFARRDGERIYDLVAGFVYSQILLALTETKLLEELLKGPMSISEIAEFSKIEEAKVKILCQSSCAIGLFERIGNDIFALSRLGAAILGVPGLQQMIGHHRLFYEDMIDPVKLLRGESTTNLSKYWPYTSGKQIELDEKVSVQYSDLMRSSQKLVAEETLALVQFAKVNKLLDVGGGTGAFIEEVAKSWPKMKFQLFDLPTVIENVGKATDSLVGKSVVELFGGSFLFDSLPAGADAVSLVRVLYDHEDTSVSMLLKKVYDALPAGGLVVISEPMSGGMKPSRSGDAYFGFYTMAMTSGRPRSPDTHFRLLAEAGFTNMKKLKGTREFITGVITAEKTV